MLSTLEVLPVAVQIAMSFGFGAIIGSFLNVVIYRFNTGKSLSGNSHCLSCGKTLRFYELFPVISYLSLRGRCRGCGSFFSARYLVVEVGTGTLFAIALMVATSTLEAAFLWLIISVLVVIVVYDIRHYIIPDILVLLLLGIMASLLAWQYWQGIISTIYLLYAVLAAAIASGVFFLLWFISKGQWLGFGDVKLVFPLALLVGPSLTFSFIVWSFWIGAIVSVGILLMASLSRGKLTLPFLSGRLTMKSAVPFAPFLIAGALLVFFTSIDVITLFTF